MIARIVPVPMTEPRDLHAVGRKTRAPQRDRRRSLTRRTTPPATSIDAISPIIDDSAAPVSANASLSLIRRPHRVAHIGVAKG